MTSLGGAWLIVLATLVGGCADGATSSDTSRNARRLYDGAPPVIPHIAFGAPCRSCHSGSDSVVVTLPDGRNAPPSPHDDTPGMSAAVCTQCHVFQLTEELFRPNDFVRADLRTPNPRLYPGAPPTLPHRRFMHENCAACHTGPATPPGIVCDHPTRAACSQCHVESQVASRFASQGG